MLRILLVITGLLSFSIEARTLSLLCEGNLSYGKKTQEDAFVEVFIADVFRPASYQGDSYIIFPNYDGFNATGQNWQNRLVKASFSEYSASKDKFVINLNYILAQTNIEIQRTTGKISIFGRRNAISGQSEWLYNGVCEKVGEENKF